MRLTILFAPPYWVGILEIERDNCLFAARHIFGAEPSDQEVHAFVLSGLMPLCARMQIGIPAPHTEAHPMNPKRQQRVIRNQLLQTSISTKAQEAIRLQIEQNKRFSHERSREDREALQKHKRVVARAKAKARHKGR